MKYNTITVLFETITNYKKSVSVFTKYLKKHGVMATFKFNFFNMKFKKKTLISI